MRSDRPYRGGVAVLTRLSQEQDAPRLRPRDGSEETITVSREGGRPLAADGRAPCRDAAPATEEMVDNHAVDLIALVHRPNS